MVLVFSVLFEWVSSYCSLVSEAVGAGSDRDPELRLQWVSDLCGRVFPRGSHGQAGGHGNVGALSVTLCFFIPCATGPFLTVPFTQQQIHKNVSLSCHLMCLHLVRGTFLGMRTLVFSEHLKERMMSKHLFSQGLVLGQ